MGGAQSQPNQISGTGQLMNTGGSLTTVKDSKVQGTTIQPGTGGVYGAMYCSPGWTMGAPPPGANSTSVAVQCYQQPTSNAAPATGTSSYVLADSPYTSVSTGQPMWAYVVAISSIVIALVLAKKSK